MNIFVVLVLSASYLLQFFSSPYLACIHFTFTPLLPSQPNLLSPNWGQVYSSDWPLRMKIQVNKSCIYEYKICGFDCVKNGQTTGDIYFKSEAIFTLLPLILLSYNWKMNQYLWCCISVTLFPIAIKLAEINTGYVNTISVVLVVYKMERNWWSYQKLILSRFLVLIYTMFCKWTPVTTILYPPVRNSPTLLLVYR